MKIKIPQWMAGLRPDAYLVGGSVRDLISGLTPMDYDITVSSPPRDLAREIAKKSGGRVVVLGKDHFTVYRVASPSWTIDITIYKGGNIRQDLLSRDFTINALACDLADSQILDITGGLADLHQGIVRMINPAVFKDDPVRLVRAFRMAAVLNFRIEPQTVDAVRAHCALLSTAAAERVWAEFVKILACPCSFKHLQLMADTGVLGAILPELSGVPEAGRNGAGMGIGLQYPLQAVDALEQFLRAPGNLLPPAPAGLVDSLDKESRALLKLSLLLHGIGKSAFGRGSPDDQRRLGGYAARSAAAAELIGRRLKMSNHQRQWIVSVVRRHRHPFFLFSIHGRTQNPPPRAMARFLMHCGHLTPCLLLHAMAQSMSTGKPCDSNEKALIAFLGGLFSIYCEKKTALNSPPILSGDDLIHLFKLRPSPFLGKILRRLKEVQLAGMIIDRRQAIEWVTRQLGSAQK